MGRQIFVFTAGNAAAQDHLAATIKAPLDLERVLSLFPPTAHDQIRSLAAEHGLYAWGAVPGIQNEPRWEAMQPGDWVLCVYGNVYHYVTQVTQKFNNETFARAIWGEDEEHKTWQLMYFLSKPMPVNIPVSTLTRYLNNGYMGFTKIGDEKLEQINAEHGSVDRFMETKFQVQGEAKEPLYFLIRSNEDSNYGDKVGQLYGFTNQVPNYTKLLNGAHVVVDRKTPTGPKIIGYGTLAHAKELEKEKRGDSEVTRYEVAYAEWHPISPPREIPDLTMTKIKSQAGYNAQHALRPITYEI